MTGIFDHGETVTISQGENRIEIGRVPGVVDRQNGARPWRDALGESIGIEVQGIGGNVGKDRTRSLIEHTVRSRGKS